MIIYISHILKGYDILELVTPLEQNKQGLCVMHSFEAKTCVVLNFQPWILYPPSKQDLWVWIQSLVPQQLKKVIITQL